MTAPFSSSASALRAELFKVATCIMVSFVLLGLTRSAFACVPVGATQWGNWYTISTQMYDTVDQASAACSAFNASLPPDISRGNICGSRVCTFSYCNGAEGQPNYGKTIYWLEVIDTSYAPYAQYLFIGGCSKCSADTEILKSECGERGYVIDEETCEGSCITCPDSDDDGVGDACDFCPDNPNYGRKEIKKYVVPGLTICGTYLYAGESCGYSIVQCDRSEEYHPISPQIIDAREMARCCRAKVEEEECVVDENCNANKDEGVCECPDGSTNCDTCQDGKCTCPDLDGDGSPDSPCQECQLPEDKCTCPDTDFDGEPNSPCDECEDEDGDGEGDGGGGTEPPLDPNDQDGDKIPDNEDPCPTNPNPNCQPGDEDGDKIPDDKDPCPKNPDPNCTTTCLTTLDKFKAWTMTAESFPFNWMRATSEMFGPLTSLNPALPDSLGVMTVELSVTEYGQSATLDFGSGYKVIRDSIVIARLSLAVKVLRWAMGITILMYMLPYFIARWSNIHGVSR